MINPVHPVILSKITAAASLLRGGILIREWYIFNHGLYWGSDDFNYSGAHYLVKQPIIMVNFPMKLSTTALFTFGAIILGTSNAFAGVPIPAPVAGALGPVGIGVAVVAYGGYRAVKHFRNR